MRLELRDSSAGEVIALDPRRAVGHFRLAVEDDSLVIDALCINETERGYGLGSESARLLIAAAATGAWSRVRAPAPPDRGLAVYFWSRMGLHPRFGERPAGGIWFERELRGLR